MSVARSSFVRGHIFGIFTGANTSVLGQGAGNALLNFTALVLNFGTTLLLSRMLGADGYGAYAFAFSLALLLSVPAVLGLMPLLVREITAYRLSSSWGAVRGILRRANECVVVASVVVCTSAVIVFTVTGWPHGRFHDPSLYVLPFIPLVALTSVRQGAMQAFGRIVLGRAPETVIMPGTLLVAVIVMALLLGDRFSASWAIGATVGAGLVGLIVGAIFLRRVLPLEARRTAPVFDTRRWAQAAVPFMLFSVVSTVGAQLPTIVLGTLSDPEDVGIYSVAVRIVRVLLFLSLAVMPAVMPAIAELITLDRTDELQQLMTRSARIVFYGSLPIFLIVIVFTEPLLQLFGSDFGGGETALRILAVGQLVNLACGLPGTALLMRGNAHTMTVTFATTTLLTVVLTAALVPSFGAEGAAIATACGVMASNLILCVVLWRRTRIYAPAVALRARA